MRQGAWQVGGPDVPFGAKGLGEVAGLWRTHPFSRGKPRCSLWVLTSQVNLLSVPTHEVLHWMTPPPLEVFPGVSKEVDLPL